jgi:hypothetical protein
MFIYIFYQEDFLIPGISPLLAISLKQILHNPNFLIKALFLPHLKHLLTIRDEYFGFFLDFAFCASVAIFFN